MERKLYKADDTPGKLATTKPETDKDMDKSGSRPEKDTKDKNGQQDQSNLLKRLNKDKYQDK